MERAFPANRKEDGGNPFDFTSFVPISLRSQPVASASWLMLRAHPVPNHAGNAGFTTFTDVVGQNLLAEEAVRDIRNCP